MPVPNIPASVYGSPLPLPLKVANLPRAADPGLQPSAVAATLIPIMKQTWNAPATASITAYLSAGVAGPNTTTSTVLRASFDGALGTAGKPDFPRNAVVTVTHATAVVAVSGTITGIDQYGKLLTEAWSVTAGTTSKTYTGAKSFYRIDSISITAASDATANTIKLGTGVVLGFAFPCSTVKPLIELQDGASASAGTTVASSTVGTADARGTYSPASAPNGARVYIVYYVSDDPTTATT